MRKTPSVFMNSVLRAVTALKAATRKYQDATDECAHIADSARQRAWTKASKTLGLEDLQDFVRKARENFVSLVIQGETDES